MGVVWYLTRECGVMCSTYTRTHASRRTPSLAHFHKHIHSHSLTHTYTAHAHTRTPHTRINTHMPMRPHSAQGKFQDDPIVASVGDVKPTAWGALFMDLHALLLVFPAGVVALLRRCVS